MRACVRIGVWLWLLDAGFALAGAHGLGLARLHGLLAGLGFAVLFFVPVGLVIDGLLSALAVDLQHAGAQQKVLFRRALRYLSEPEREIQARRVGAILGALPVSAVFAALGFAGARSIITGMVRPHFAAIAIVVLHACLVLACAAMYWAMRGPCVALADRLGALRGIGWLFARASRLLALLSALFLLVLGALLVTFWGTFALLPWQTIECVAGALAIALASFELCVRVPKLEEIEGYVLGVVCAAAFGALCTLDPRAEISRRAVFDTLDGRLGFAAALLAFDFDRDGHLGMFGGGDCAPFDRTVSPVAVDIPNNGRDEDCDGADLDARRLSIELQRDWPVPSEFPKRPSIVLITIDTFAASRMRALGNKRVVTPFLDAFAKRSALFRYAFSQGPSTRLSFPAMFASRWDSQIKKVAGIGSRPYAIDDSEVLLAEVFSGQGYETAAIAPDAYFKKSRWPTLLTGFKQVIDSPTRVTTTHNSPAVTDAALSVWQRERKKPLFLWVHYYDAHSPHTQPKDIEKFGTSHADVYDAELKLCDREVGRLLAAIDQTAAAEQPIVVVTGDHGIAFDSPRHTQFNYGYDLTTAVLHVPLIVHGPMIRPQVSDSIVSTMDIAPTLTNLARVGRVLPFEGASLEPELLEGRASRPQRLVHEFYLAERTLENADPLEAISLRSERFNLINDRKKGSFELYDFRADYFENHNLADAPEYAKTLLGMKRQLALYTYRLYGSEQIKTPQARLTPVH